MRPPIHRTRVPAQPTPGRAILVIGLMAYALATRAQTPAMALPPIQPQAPAQTSVSGSVQPSGAGRALAKVPAKASRKAAPASVADRTPSSGPSQVQHGKPLTQPESRWWLVPLSDRLNRHLDAFSGEVGRVVQPDVPLADRLNRGLDNLFAGVSLLAVRPADGSQAWWEKPLADRINARLDNLGRIIGSIERRDVARLARDLGINGPTIWPDRVLPEADAELDPEADLSLMQAWRAAAINDPSLRAARAGLASARERLPQARSQLLPQVQLGVTRVSNDLTRQGQNLSSQPLTIFDRYPSANDTLSLRQPILRAAQVLGIRQAQAVEREAEAVFARDEQEFSSRVVLAYLEVLLAQDNQRLIESQREFLDSALKAATRNVVAGVGTRTDVDAAQAKADLNRVQGLQARQQIELARRQLQTLINRPFGTLRPLDGNKLATISDDRTLDDWVREAEAGSPEIRRLVAQREGLSQELNKARTAHLPTLDLVAQIQRSRSENTLSPQSQFQNRSLGLQLNVPLYSGGYVNSLARQASADVERVEETLAAARLDLGVKVHREYRGVSEGLLRVKALEVAVRSSEVALDSARKSVTAGVRTSVDVLNAQQQLSEALRNLAEARYSLLASLARLHTLAGLNGEALVQRIDQVLAY